jgi:hypothetical protein
LLYLLVLSEDYYTLLFGALAIFSCWQSS